jgi:hypothetical protein
LPANKPIRELQPTDAAGGASYPVPPPRVRPGGNAVSLPRGSRTLAGRLETQAMSDIARGEGGQQASAGVRPETEAVQRDCDESVNGVFRRQVTSCG